VQRHSGLRASRSLPQAIMLATLRFRTIELKWRQISPTRPHLRAAAEPTPIDGRRHDPLLFPPDAKGGVLCGRDWPPLRGHSRRHQQRRANVRRLRMSMRLSQCSHCRDLQCGRTCSGTCFVGRPRPVGPAVIDGDAPDRDPGSSACRQPTTAGRLCQNSTISSCVCKPAIGQAPSYDGISDILLGKGWIS
jgi:hypothetical protein